MKIVSLEIDAFRGYNSPIRFDFSNSNVILLYAANGHGKTSFFDAIEWALTGQLFRFSQSSDERSQSRFIGNSFSDRNPIVQIHLHDQKLDRIIKITRIGAAAVSALTDYGLTKVELEIESNHDRRHYDGHEAETMLSELLIYRDWSGKVELNRTLSLTHMLGQDRFQDILKGMKDSERYDSLSQVFGTEHFYAFQQTITETKQNIQAMLRNKKLQENQADNLILELTAKLEILSQKMTIENIQLLSLEKDTHDFMKVHSLLLSENQENPYQDVKNNITLRFNTIKNELLVLGNEQSSFKHIEMRIPEIKQLLQLTETLQNQSKLLSKAKLLYQLRTDLLWVNQQIDSFLTAQERSDRLEKQYEEHIRISHEHEQFASHMNQFLSEVQVSISNKKDKFHFTEMIKSYPSIDLSIKSPIIDQININDASVQNWNAIAQYHQKEKENVDRVIRRIEGKTEINQKYRHFLSVVRDFAQQNRDVSNCPACGTEGVTAEQLLQNIAEQQSLLDPELLDLEKELEASRSALTKRWNELEEAKQTLSNNEEKLINLLKDLENSVTQRLTEVSILNAKAFEVQNQREEAGRLLERFKRIAGNLNLDTRQENLKRNINKLKVENEENWSIISSQLNLSESDDLDRLILDCDMSIQKSENQVQVFSVELFKRSIVFIKDVAWISNELFQLVTDGLNSIELRMNDLNEEQGSLLKLEDALKQLDLHKDVKTLNNRLSEAIILKQQAIQEIAEFEKKVAILDELYRNVPHAIDKLNEQVIDQLFDTIQEIFDRLNCHPLYRILTYSTLHRRRANRLLLSVVADREASGSSRANPSYIFSSAQVNTIVLSFFLAMAQSQHWTPLSFVALDDPLQSMDDLNVLSFIDLMRNYADMTNGLGKQLIISTHDITFYELMKKKFRNMNIGVVEFESYGEHGPILMQSEEQQMVRLIPAEPRVQFSNDFLLTHVQVGEKKIDSEVDFERRTKKHDLDEK